MTVCVRLALGRSPFFSNKTRVATRQPPLRCRWRANPWRLRSGHCKGISGGRVLPTSAAPPLIPNTDHSNANVTYGSVRIRLTYQSGCYIRQSSIFTAIREDYALFRLDVSSRTRLAEHPRHWKIKAIIVIHVCNNTRRASVVLCLTMGLPRWCFLGRRLPHLASPISPCVCDSGGGGIVAHTCVSCVTH